MNNTRFEALDGLRGVAALIVAFGHIGQYSIGTILVPNFNLPVPFFFMLSGFILSHTYLDRLGAGLPFATYLKRRAIRLFPLIVLSGLSASGYLLLRYRSGQLPGLDDAKILIAVVSSVTALPVPFLDIDQWRWPANPPLWSMFWEIVASIALGGLAFLGRVRPLVITAVLAAGTLIVTASRSEVVGNGLLGGAALSCYGFCIGILIDRIQHRISQHWIRLGRVSVAIFMIVLVLPVAPEGKGFLILTIVFFLPLVLIGGMAMTPRGWVSKLCEIGGEISYPLYMLHFSVTHWAIQLGFTPGNVTEVGAMLALCVLVSALVLRVYDEPLRRWLGTLKLSRLRVQPEME